MASPDVTTFLAFFLRWARVQGWAVPPLHVRICHWLDTCDDPERVLMVFRGAAKSTIYAVYKAYRLWKNRQHRSLVWSADNDTAGMLTADTINVLRNHPWCGGMLPPKPGAKKFWVTGARDARNASMRAVGVTSNATGARADDVDFDDIEVPGNIETPEARLKMRQRISESTHIAVPGAQKTFIGTPHTHDSIYPERIAGGAAVLKIALFEHSIRYTKTDKALAYKAPPIGADGLYVMTGIHNGARLLEENVDYQLRDGLVTFKKPPGVVLDIVSGCQWPERFNRTEIAKRRRETRTLNAWDSQYMLEAKPLTEVRLDPQNMREYEVEPIFRRANGDAVMVLGRARITGASCKWDPAGGKLKSDVSSFSVMLFDDMGNRYWHRAIELKGEVAEFDEQDHKTIVGGQVFGIVAALRELQLSRVVVETNGAGTFAPTVLKAAIKQAKLKWPVGVTPKHETLNKNKRILEAFDGPLNSGKLWAHSSVIAGPARNQMRDFNPAITEQPDDHLDSGAGALTEAPERIGKLGGVDLNASAGRHDDWRPATGVYEVELES